MKGKKYDGESYLGGCEGEETTKLLKNGKDLGISASGIEEVATVFWLKQILVRSKSQGFQYSLAFI